MAQISPGREPAPEPQSSRGAELAFLALVLRRAEADVDLNETLSQRERRSFYRAAGNYYHASRQEIAAIGRKLPHPDEIPVALHFARCAGLDPKQVLKHRLEGGSWTDVLEHLNLSPEIFYVPVVSPMKLAAEGSRETSGARDPETWRVLALLDTDIVNLVNLKFISDYYGYRPEQVIALSALGWSFAAIHAELDRLAPVERAHKTVTR